MTTNLLLEVGAQELPLASHLVAKRVRGLLAEEQFSGRRMAALMGMDATSFSRRHRGHVAWSIDDLAKMASLTGRPFAEFVEPLCASRDLNPEPADSRPAVASVIPLPVRCALEPAYPAAAARHLRIVGRRAS